MTEIFGYPLPVIFGQLMLGLVNGSFYAMLSLGLAVIFGLLGVVNFAHGAFYTLGAFAALRRADCVRAQLLARARRRAARGRRCSGSSSSGCCCATSTGSIRCTDCCSRSASP